MTRGQAYNPSQRADAVALAAAIGPVKAGAQLGIPRRTISDWLNKPASSAIVAAAEQDIADRLRDAHSRALAAVMAGLNDPKARLADRAKALEVLGQQLALAEGRATSASFNVNVDAADPWADLSAEESRALVKLLDHEIREREEAGAALSPEAVGQWDEAAEKVRQQ